MGTFSRLVFVLVLMLVLVFVLVLGQMTLFFCIFLILGLNQGCILRTSLVGALEVS